MWVLARKSLTFSHALRYPLTITNYYVSEEGSMKRDMVWGLIVVLVLSASWAFAQGHADKVKGPFKSGPEVTTACLACHDKQAKDFMKTVHWTWSKKQEVPGKGPRTWARRTPSTIFASPYPATSLAAQAAMQGTDGRTPPSISARQTMWTASSAMTLPVHTRRHPRVLAPPTQRWIWKRSLRAWARPADAHAGPATSSVVAETISSTATLTALCQLLLGSWMSIWVPTART